MLLIAAERSSSYDPNDFGEVIHMWARQPYHKFNRHKMDGCEYVRRHVPRVEVRGLTGKYWAEYAIFLELMHPAEITIALSCGILDQLADFAIK